MTAQIISNIIYYLTTLQTHNRYYSFLRQIIFNYFPFKRYALSRRTFTSS